MHANITDVAAAARLSPALQNLFKLVLAMALTLDHTTLLAPAHYKRNFIPFKFGPNLYCCCCCYMNKGLAHRAVTLEH